MLSRSALDIESKSYLHRSADLAWQTFWTCGVIMVYPLSSPKTIALTLYLDSHNPTLSRLHLLSPFPAVHRVPLCVPCSSRRYDLHPRPHHRPRQSLPLHTHRPRNYFRRPVRRRPRHCWLRGGPPLVVDRLGRRARGAGSTRTILHRAEVAI